ncbi:FAD:protein FMN transferase [Buchnera aphidicola]|uniref:FAD:protein FMN transferase n=1 Tax=Buchnera aphidicola TaxID=9 RepID=UPI0034644E29
MSASGSYLDYFYLKNICHIINPPTSFPIKYHLTSVSVIANIALEPDAWDTGLMIMGF